MQSRYHRIGLPSPKFTNGDEAFFQYIFIIFANMIFIYATWHHSKSINKVHFAKFQQKTTLSKKSKPKRSDWKQNEIMTTVKVIQWENKKERWNLSFLFYSITLYHQGIEHSVTCCKHYRHLVYIYIYKLILIIIYYIVLLLFLFALPLTVLSTLGSISNT